MRGPIRSWPLRSSFRRANDPTGHVAILSVPRDTDVMLPNGREDKINAAYAVGGSPLTDAHASEQAVAQFLGLPGFDRFVTLRINAAKELVDAIGGIDVVPDETMNYDDNWGHLHIHFIGGKTYHMNGDQAVSYSRFRHDECSDPCRIKRQQQVIRIVLAKLQNDKFHDLLHLNSLIDIIHRNVYTNLSQQEILSMALAFEHFDKADLMTSQVPVRGRKRARMLRRHARRRRRRQGATRYQSISSRRSFRCLLLQNRLPLLPSFPRACTSSSRMVRALQVKVRAQRRRCAAQASSSTASSMPIASATMQPKSMSGHNRLPRGNACSRPSPLRDASVQPAAASQPGGARDGDRRSRFRRYRRFWGHTVRAAVSSSARRRLRIAGMAAAIALLAFIARHLLEYAGSPAGRHADGRTRSGCCRPASVCTSAASSPFTTPGRCAHRDWSRSRSTTARIPSIRRFYSMN